MFGEIAPKQRSGTRVGWAFFALPNPSALTFPQINADNTVTALSAAAFRSAIGAGGGDALTANPLSQFASTTSAQLAGVISDETGTGALCFANSPTLVTPALGTPASGVLTNCSGTAASLTVGNVTTNAITSQTADSSPDGANDYVLTYDASATALKKVLLNNLPASSGTVGAIAQMLHGGTGAVSTGTTTVPFDDTIPQSNEGDQYITQAITPKKNGNILRVRAQAFCSPSVAAFIIGSLYQDSTANALVSSCMYIDTGTGVGMLTMEYQTTATSTSSTTFKLRVGMHTAGTLTFNGQVATRLFGTVANSFLEVMEISQ